MTVKVFKNKKPTIEPIKVIEPFKSDVLTFENPEDFTTYYRTHEEDFNGISTVLLNRKYKIPGYRITQKKKSDDEPRELALKKDYYVGVNKTQEPINNDRIEALEETVENLRKELNNIIKYLQESN